MALDINDCVFMILPNEVPCSVYEMRIMHLPTGKFVTTTHYSECYAKLVGLEMLEKLVAEGMTDGKS